MITIREQDPLKQGLKPLLGGLSEQAEGIREQDPLKQGLKRIWLFAIPGSPTIREQDPLKQGLKHPTIKRSITSSI